MTPAARQAWPCVDNASCEIQLSLLEQRQKLLDQKRHASTRSKASTTNSAKSRAPLHAGPQNGDVLPHSVLNCLDNRPRDNERILRKSATTSSRYAHLNSASIAPYRGNMSSVNDFLADRSRHSYADAPDYKSASDVPAVVSVVVGVGHTGERTSNITEEQSKPSHLQQLHGSRKSGKLHKGCFNFGIVVDICVDVVCSCNGDV